MNTRSLERRIVRCLIVALHGLLVSVGTVNGAEKTNQPPASPSATNATNAPAKQAPIEIPVSQFVIPTTATDGRNPFFPDSIMNLKTGANTTTNAAGKTATVALDLKGISGTGTKRFALINNRTFEAEEDGDVTVSGSRKIRVHCITIREDSVSIEADGVRQELRLRPGL